MIVVYWAVACISVLKKYIFAKCLVKKQRRSLDVFLKENER